MAFKLSPKLADVGLIAGGITALAGGPLAALAIPAFLKAYQSHQEDKEAAKQQKANQNAFITGRMNAPEYPDWVGQKRDLTDDEMRALGAKVAPQEMTKARLDQMFPDPDEYGQPVAGEALNADTGAAEPAFGQYGKRGGFKGPRGFHPAQTKPNMGNLVRLTGPKGQTITAYENEQRVVNLLRDGWNKEGAQPPERPLGRGQLYKNTFGSDVPENMRPAVDQFGNLTGELEGIPGGAADPAVMERKRVAGLKQAFPKTKGALDSALSEIDQTSTLIDDILSPASDTGLGDVTGFGGGAVGDFFTMGGTEGANVRAKIKQLESRTMIDSLANLKTQSPTGASGFGALSEKEGEILKNARAALDRSQDMASYKKALTDYKAALAGTKSRLVGTFRQEFSPLLGGQQGTQDPAEGGQSQQQGAAQAAPSRPDVSQLPPGAKMLPDGRAQLPNGKIVRWVS